MNSLRPYIAARTHTEQQTSKVVRVKTDVLDLEINTQGGTVQYSALLDYPVTKKNESEKIVLLKSRDNFQ